MNSADFHSANPDTTLIENFEGTSPSIRDGSLASYSSAGGEITFIPIASYPFDPNLVLASPGYTNFGSGLNPTTSVVLSATGNEDFVASLAAPTYALGFDVLLNDFPLTISFFDGSTLLATLNFDTPPESGKNLAFAGITSTEGITSFHWQATEGQNVNTGIDNIFLGPASVPEPSSWTMMLLGFGALGTALRRRSKGSFRPAICD
jgi:hypothetical protein